LQARAARRRLVRRPRRRKISRRRSSSPSTAATAGGGGGGGRRALWISIPCGDQELGELFIIIKLIREDFSAFLK
jgi:hypothetical protein